MPSQAPAAPSAPTGTSASSHAVKVVLKVPAGRKPSYVSPSTLGVTVSAYSVLSTPAPAQAYDLSPTSSICTTTPPGGVATPDPSGTRYCTLAITAPVGNDYMFVTAYDTAPVEGSIPVSAHALSSGAASVTVAANASNTFSLSLGGIVSGIALSPGSFSVPAGSSTPITFIVQALDAQNNTIIGPDGFVNPITLTLSDNCAYFKFAAKQGACTSPSTTTLTVPANNGLNSVVVDPNGTAFTTNVTLTASTTTASGTVTTTASLQPGSVTFTPAPVTVPAYPNGGIALGTGNSVDFYAPGYAVVPNANPTVAPGATPSPLPNPPNTLLSLNYSAGINAAQIAFSTDSSGQTWTYIADTNTNSSLSGGGLVEIYSQSDLSTGNPTYVIDSNSFCNGSVGGFIDGVAADSYGNVYVANTGTGGNCMGAHGPSPNARRAASSHRAGPARVHPQIQADNSSINVFRPSSYQSGGTGSTYSGYADWTISGTNTQLSQPSQIAVDANNYLLVANSVSGSVNVYGIGVSGNVAPLAVFAEPGAVSGSPVQLVTTPTGGIVSYNSQGGAVSAFTYDVVHGTTTNPFNFVTASVGTPPLAPQNAVVDSQGNLVGWNQDYTKPFGLSQNAFEIIDYAPNFATLLGSGGTPLEFGIMAYPSQGALTSMAAVPAGLISSLGKTAHARQPR